VVRAREELLTPAEVSEGIGWLIRFFHLLPRLRSALLVGRDAQAEEDRIILPPGVRAFRAPLATQTNLNCNKGTRAAVLIPAHANSDRIR
jgi:hypothetical protein